VYPYRRIFFSSSVRSLFSLFSFIILLPLVVVVVLCERSLITLTVLTFSISQCSSNFSPQIVMCNVLDPFIPVFRFLCFSPHFFFWILESCRPRSFLPLKSTTFAIISLHPLCFIKANIYDHFTSVSFDMPIEASWAISTSLHSNNCINVVFKYPSVPQSHHY